MGELGFLLSFAEYPPELFPCPGVNDRLNIGHYVLATPCSFFFHCGVSKGANYVFFISILDWAVSDLYTGKTWCRARTKILWFMDIGSIFLIGEPFSLWFFTQQSFSRLHKAMCRGVVVHPLLLVTYHLALSVIPSVCYVHLCATALFASLVVTILVYKYMLHKPRDCMVVMKLQRL